VFVISSKFRYQTFRDVGLKFDRILSFLSPFALTALLGIAAVWAVETPPVQASVSTSRVPIDTHSNSSIRVPLVIQAHARRAVYRMWLTDAQGSTVYRFPSQYFENLSVLDLKHSNLSIPPLDNGVYSLHIEIVYQFNPFKNGRIAMVAATLNVKN
jgi:hypothetical protein